MEKPFEIIESDGFYCVKCKKSSVAVITYRLGEDGLLEGVGLVTEKNPFFRDSVYKGLVMGGVEREDKSLLMRAKQETMEEAGYEVNDDLRWKYIGEMNTGKVVQNPVYCFSVDLTGLDGSAPRGDGTENEKGISFEFIPLNQAFNIPDSLYQACLFKLFANLYKTDIQDGIS
jgi:8-oxo-dGTP pyrophosphatase MutT (NUDIX family)